MIKDYHKEIKKKLKELRLRNCIGLLFLIPLFVFILLYLVYFLINPVKPPHYSNAYNIELVDKFSKKQDLYSRVPSKVLLTKANFKIVSPKEKIPYIKYNSNLGKELRQQLNIKQDMTVLKLYRTKYNTWGYQIDKSNKYQYYDNSRVKQKESDYTRAVSIQLTLLKFYFLSFLIILIIYCLLNLSSNIDIKGNRFLDNYGDDKDQELKKIQNTCSIQGSIVNSICIVTFVLLYISLGIMNNQ